VDLPCLIQQLAACFLMIYRVAGRALFDMVQTVRQDGSESPSIASAKMTPTAAKLHFPRAFAHTCVEFYLRTTLGVLCQLIT